MIELNGIQKNYVRGAEEVHALRGVDLEIGKGEFVSVVGPSGSGKTTMLHIMGCLDQPSLGVMKIDGAAVDQLPEKELVRIRREKIGFVFQQFHLIPGLSVYENVTLPLLFARREADEAKIRQLLDLIGLDSRRRHHPNQLSGGEMQRVAVARAMVNDPEVLFADEPTGNLDTENSDRIFDLLSALHARGLTIVMVTHNNELATRSQRIIRLQDGQVQN